VIQGGGASVSRSSSSRRKIAPIGHADAASRSSGICSIYRDAGIGRA
jgi:hypothetical protein